MPDERRARQNQASAAARLLAWYDKNRRHLPWRAMPGETPDPYRVWLSEVMLQQTTVAAAGRYYREFVSRWPDVHALANASLDEVRAGWAGLGYYSRARNLHRTAQIVARELDGAFPRDVTELRKLPGLGPYTAGAVAAIAFGAREAAVDANAERVIARYFSVRAPLPSSKGELRARAQSLVPEVRPGDFAQALMDLGALVCTPRRPACGKCPWARGCSSWAQKLQELLPLKAAKPQRPLKRGAAFVARNEAGAILLVKRPESGLLGGMLQPPLGPWTERLPSREQAFAQAPFSGPWERRRGLVRHGFTHFELEIAVWRADISARQSVDGLWLAPHELKSVALPTVMRKIIAHALEDGPPSSSPRRRTRLRGDDAKRPVHDR